MLFSTKRKTEKTYFIIELYVRRNIYDGFRSKQIKRVCIQFCTLAIQRNFEYKNPRVQAFSWTPHKQIPSTDVDTIIIIELLHPLLLPCSAHTTISHRVICLMQFPFDTIIWYMQSSLRSDYGLHQCLHTFIGPKGVQLTRISTPLNTCEWEFHW